MTFLQIFLPQVSIHGFAKTKKIVSRFFLINLEFLRFQNFARFERYEQITAEAINSNKFSPRWKPEVSEFATATLFSFISLSNLYWETEIILCKKSITADGKLQMLERQNEWRKSVSAIWHLKRSGCVQGCLGSAPFLDSRGEAEPRKLPAVESHLKPIAISTQEQQLLLKHPSSHLSPQYSRRARSLDLKSAFSWGAEPASCSSCSPFPAVTLS